MIAREDEIQELGPVEIGPDLLDGQRRGRGRSSVEEHHSDVRAGLPAILLDHRRRQGGRIALEQVQIARHQKIMNRVACGTNAAISSVVTDTSGCPSAFHPGSPGRADVSTWKGMPSFRSAARYFAMSSPSTRSSVSSSSRWTAGPVSTMRTGFSPATTPSAMRMASFARCDTRGSSEMRTSTGWWSAMPSVERDEAIGAVDHVGQNDQPAVGRQVGQGQAALLASVGADEEARPPAAERLDALVLDGRHAVVDQVEIHLVATVERRRGESQCRGEVGMIRRRGNHETELALRRFHSGAERSIATGERQ